MEPFITFKVIIKHFIYLEEEDKASGLSTRRNKGEVLQSTFNYMRWPHIEPKPIATDNFTVAGITNDTINQHRLK